MSRRDVEDVYPLSPAQQGMLFHALLEPGTGVYLGQVLYRLSGTLDVDALTRALRRTAAAYPVLRTSFVWEGLDEPLQVVRRDVEIPLQRRDLRGLSAQEAERRLREVKAADLRAGFDLSRAPLTRFTLLEGDAEQHLIWTFHHLLLDGWSVPLVVRRILALYAAFAAGAPEPALPRPRPYRDYIARLRQRDAAAQETFWRRLLEGAEVPTPLGVDRGAGEEAPAGRGETRHDLPREVATALEETARRHRLTVNTLLQGAWALLLSRYSRSRDVVFGVTTSGRPADLPGAEGMVGMFINTLPLRLRVDPSARLFDWLAEVQSLAAEVREHEASPLVEVQRWAGAPAGRALFDSILVFENFPSLRGDGDGGDDGGDGAAAAAAGAGLPSVEQRAFAAPTHYPLTLLARPRPLALTVETDRRRLDDEAARRLAAHLGTLLAAFAAAEDDARLGELSHVGEEERRRLVDGCNDTAVAFAALDGVAEPTLHGFVARQAAATPDAEAVRYGDEAWTYSELVSRARRLAAALGRRGVVPGEVVGVCLERGLEMEVALLGVLLAGAAYLPLEPELPAPRRAFLAEDSACRWVLGRRAEADTAERPVAEELAADGRRTVTVEELLAEAGDVPAVLPGERLPADAVAYVIYTSGSTGRPKGVAVPHRAIVNRLLWMQSAYPLAAGDRVLQKTPFGFDVSVWELFWPLMVGAGLVFARPGGHRDPDYLVRVLCEAGITVVHFVPSMLAAFLDAPRVADCAAVLRRVVTSGEALSPALARRFFRRLGAVPGAGEGGTVELDNLYGPTEAAVDVSAWTCTPDDLAAGVPIGHPIANVSLHVLDRRGDVAGVGVPGELVIGGVALAHGYLGRPALTAERFVPDPFAVPTGEPGSRLYRTGDLARRRGDGAVEFLGRLDHQVKVRGYRVELGEIEAVLAEHPAVRECAVLLRAPEGDTDQRLVAYVAAGADAETTPQGLAEHLRRRLPEAMVPAHFLLLDALPQTASGKIDRRALPAPRLERSALGTPYEAPRTPGEELLAGLWQQVLGVARVGRRDDFFALGGHSLLALRLLGRLRETLGVELDLAALFASGTLADMAERVDAALRGESGEAAPPLVPVPRDEPLPLSFAQQRLWFLHQLDPASAAYHIPLALVLRGELHPGALAAAFSALVARHEALRTRFLLLDGEPRQEADEPFGVALPVVDLSALPAARRAGVESRLVAAMARLPFDLARGPLLRTLLLRRGGGEHVLLLTVHHVVSDARSMEVMLRETGVLYAAARSGRRADLAPLPVQYADYAAWERAWRTPAALEDEVAWWRRTLEGADEVLELPTDRPRPAVQSQRGAHLAFDLPADLVAALDALARRAGVTPFMVLLAGWLTLLRRYTGQPWINVGTTTAGRDRAAVADLIGFFVNTLVLRTEVDGDPSFQDLLARVRRTTLGAYAHRTLPFERLVDELRPRRDLSTTPFFQTVLTFHQGEAAAPGLSELAVASLPTDTRTAKFDLELEVSWRRGGESGDAPHAARANFEYASDLFDATTVARFGRHLVELLRGAAAEPATPLSRLPLLPAAERTQVLREWNDSAVASVPRERTFIELFARHVEATPDRVAATCGDLAVTYGELDRRAGRLARRLVARGFGPERVVALFTLRDLDALAAILAVFKAGGAYVPLDPLHPTRRLTGVLAASGARLALVAGVLAAEMEEVVAGVEAARRPQVLELGSALAPDEAGGEEAPPVELPAPDARHETRHDPRHLAYVIFTSGSTGTPKGAMLEQRGMVNHLYTKVLDLGLGAGDVVAQTSNISFDVHVWQFLVALLVGGRTDVFDDEQSLDARRLLTRLEEQAVSVVETVPSQLRVLLEEAERAGDGAPRLRSLRWMIPNGEVLPPELCRRWLAAYPATSMINAYGPTECSDDVLHHAMHQAPPQDRPVPIGRPLPNLRLYVLDAAFEAAPIGVPGDLYVAGAGVGRGYLDDPRRTAVTFLPNPLAGRVEGEPGSRLYRTGDRARWLADGRLDFLGRVDFQVKVRGFRIEPGEIEAALRTHPAVEQAVVLARGDGPRGDLYLCAYLVLSRPTPVAEVQEHVADRVPPYMVPARFVILDEMPLTANGKVNRKALPAPEAPSDEAVPYEAPRGATEETVARVWRDVLGVERVGRDDDFFALGGHSLSATRVTIRLADELGLEVPVRTLFLQPTVAKLAASLDEVRRASASPEDADERIRELRERIARMKAEQEARAGTEAESEAGERRAAEEVEA